MNANQLINMIMRMFVRKMVSRGMDAGIKTVSGAGKNRRRSNRRREDDQL